MSSQCYHIKGVGICVLHPWGRNHQHPSRSLRKEDVVSDLRSFKVNFEDWFLCQVLLFFSTIGFKE